ncbi:MAG: MG2 domain-containing protein [Desulforegulaceae bacterium]|nr:MG2 domain-containing protein [Desulforegulaceae bacterium]
MKKILNSIFKFIVFFIGKPGWTPPPWFYSLKNLKSEKPGLSKAFTFIVSFVVVISLAGCVYLTKKKSDYLSPQVIPPDINLIEKPGKVEISFSKEGSNEFFSVADINFSDKKIESGIKISPSINGFFEFKGDNLIVFNPSENWKADTEYKISFNKSIFLKNLLIKDYYIKFKTPEFKADTSSSKFYTDPKNKKIHKGIFAVSFNYPVFKDSDLSQKIKLEINKKPINYDLEFDEKAKTLFIHSKPVEIKENTQYLDLFIEKGIKTSHGEASTKNSVESRIAIPSMENFFKVENISSQIVNNEKNEPVQTIVLMFTAEVLQKELEKKVKIWLLPRKKNNTRWNSPGEISDSLLETAQKVNFSFAPNERESSRSFGIKLDLEERRDIYIEIERGLKSDSGYYFSKGFSDVLSTPDYPKEIEIIGSGGLLSLSGDKTISFKSRGVKGIKVVIYRLLENQLQHLITQAGGDISRLDFSHYYLNKENLGERFEKIIPLNPKHPKIASYSSLNLSEFLNQDGKKPGYFFIEANSYDPYENRYDYYNVNDRRCILLTDLLILLKTNYDGAINVFVHSLSKESPVNMAKVSVLGKNGISVLDSYTDEYGYVFIQSLNDFTNEKQPVAITVKSGNDISFIKLGDPARTLNHSSFDTGGVRSRYANPDRINAFLFSDRGIYRPGEEFNLGAIVRHKGFEIPRGIPVEYSIYDSRGNERLKKRIKVSDSGFFDISFKTEQTDPTGRWTIELYLVSDKGYRESTLGLETVKIETFEPDRLKISSKLSKSDKGWLIPENLKTEVTLLNLFGTPAQNNKVTADFKLVPSSFTFDEYKNYSFTDPFYSSDRVLKTISRSLGSKNTDIDGKTFFDLDFDSFDKGTYRLFLNIKGFEKGDAKSVDASNRAFICPMDYLVGYKTSSNLSYLRKNSKNHLDFIAINNELEKISKENLVLKFKKAKEIQALVQKPDKTYEYKIVKKEEVKKEENFSISEKGSKIQLFTEEPGDYVYEIFDNGKLLSRIEYFVAGALNEAGKIEKTAVVDVKLSKKDYKPGEFLEAEIITPYRGFGLLTIESERVYVHKWFKATSSRTIQVMEIPSSIEGNAYFSVSMARAFDDPSIFESPSTYFVKPFYIEKSKRVLNPLIEVAENIKPGDELEIFYSTDKKAKTAIFIADEGILQAGDYNYPLPLDHFLKKRALEVDTAQIADLVIPEFRIIREKLGIGGGARYEESAKLLAANLNPFKRTINDPAVKWFGILDSDQNKKSVKWKVPDTFNGTLKVMAVSAEKSSMGFSKKPVLARAPFVLSPTSPLAVTFKDSFKVTLNVSNLLKGSGKNCPITVKMEADDKLTIKGETSKIINIDENSEKTVEFIVETKNEPGNAKLKFYATSGDTSSTTSASISIRPFVPYKTTIVSGFSGSGKKNIKIDRSLINDFSKQTVLVSKSPLIFVKGLYTWLDKFPHECTEQLVSKAFPALVFSKAGIDIDAFENVSNAIKALRQRQTSNGGFSMWPGSKEHAFSSLYSIHFLIETKQSGFDIPETILQRSVSYLEEKASSVEEGVFEKRIKSYSVYLLTRLGHRTSNHLQDMEDNYDKKEIKNDIVSVFAAASLKLLRSDYEADKKIESFDFEQYNPEDDYWFNPANAYPFYLYILGKHFPSNFDKIFKSGIDKLLEPVYIGNFNTTSSALTILALSFNLDEESSDETTVEFIDSDKNKTMETLGASKIHELEFSTGIKSISINSKTPFYYLVSQSGYDDIEEVKPVSNKVEVIREYFDFEGNKLENPKRGKDYEAVIKIRSLTGKMEPNIAVIDLFPGGFYPDLESLRKNSGIKKAEYIDVREDRAVFYLTAAPQIMTFKYKFRAGFEGDFTIPSIQAESLYDVNLNSLTKMGKVSVNP